MDLTTYLVDVFGSGAFSGNPLAVIAGADHLDTDQMQRITRWFSFSETAFLLSARHPDADYRVRIFTLDREMPFAGHPTLGTCHTWLESGEVPRHNTEVVQECGAGLVRVRRDHDGLLAFAAPPLVRSGTPTPDEKADACQFLDIDPRDIVDARWIDNGPGWLGIRLASADDVLSLNPQRDWPRRIDVGVFGPHAPGADADIEIRAFFSDHNGGIVEDPVTGSLNASVAQWLFETDPGIGTTYTAAQGRLLGREGDIHLSLEDSGQVWVAGQTHTHVIGTLHH
jgi:PhzF family phenazine biosynthesis protein